MAQSLEEYVAQTTKAYQPAYDSIQSQLNALSGKLETANQAINKNYEQQQDTLNRNRNAAAEAASMQAAGSGGSFGGMANIANRKYYDQTFVPAQTQLQTNQVNELAQARQNNENERQSLNSQLASLQAQANQQAMQQYWAEVEAERQRQFQAEQAEKERQAQAAANSAQNAYYQYWMDAIKNAQNNSGGTKAWDFGNGYVLYADRNGNARYTRDGQDINRGSFLTITGANGTNWNMWNDIWNNGVRTNGIGSDTLDAFNGLLRATKNKDKYGYLWS